MAPPTRHRPHLDDLLQKNLELEHVVADLRHQLTQSFAKWADERKTLATGCDTLMASFAKFRARLDVHSSDLVDSEGEIEENLDGGMPSEETGEVDNLNGMLETEGDQALSIAGDLRERCDALTAELHVKEEELKNSQRRHEAAEEELQRVQLQAALAFAKADITNELSLEERTFNDASTQIDPPKGELEDTLEKLRLANEDINRLKQLVQQWKKYGNDWKRDAQSARARTSELELREAQLNTKVQAAEESKALLETERNEVQRLTSALADQTAALDHQRTACQESLKRVHALEATVSLLQARLTPEQLASGQKQAAPEPSSSTKSPTRADTDPNKRSDMIVLKIPYRVRPSLSVDIPISESSKSVKQPTGENSGPQDDQQIHARAGSSTSANPIPQTNNIPLTFNPNDYEVCIHTCNGHLCRNESHSILWLRKQASLPRHALSEKKHRRCNPACPGHRLLAMPITEALREPRRARCRPPTEVEVTMAAAEADKISSTRKTRMQKTEAEGETRHKGSGEPEDDEEPEGSGQEDEEDSPRLPMKRLARPHGEERARKLRPRHLYAR